MATNGATITMMATPAIKRNATPEQREALGRFVHRKGINLQDVHIGYSHIEQTDLHTRISIDEDRELDRRAQHLGITKSGYLRALIRSDLARPVV